MKHFYLVASILIPLLSVGCTSLKSARHYDANGRKFERVKVGNAGVERIAYYDVSGRKRAVKKFADIYTDDQRSEVLNFIIKNIRWIPPRPKGSVGEVDVTISLLIEKDGTISNFRLLHGTTRSGSIQLKTNSIPPELVYGTHPVELTIPYKAICYCAIRDRDWGLDVPEEKDFGTLHEKVRLMMLQKWVTEEMLP